MAAIPQISNPCPTNPAIKAGSAPATQDTNDAAQDFLSQLLAVFGGGSQDPSLLTPLNAKGAALLKKAGELKEKGADDKDPDMSDTDMAQLASLFQQFPNLQQLLTGKLSAADLGKALNNLQANGALPAGLTAKLDPALLKDLKNLATQTDPAQLKGLQNLLTKMTATDDQGQLAALSDKIKQAVAAITDKTMTTVSQAVVADAAPAEKTASRVKDTNTATDIHDDRHDEIAVKNDLAAKDLQPKAAPDNRAPTNVERDAKMAAQKESAQKEAQDVSKPEFDARAKVASVSGAVLEQPAIAVAATAESTFNNLATADDKNLSVSQAQLASQSLQGNGLNIMADKLDAYALQQAKAAVPVHPASMMVSIQMYKAALAGQNQTMLIQLQPQELGRIEVRLRFEGGRVKAHIAADKAETLDLMKNDSDALANALQGAGLEANADTLSFSLRDGSQNPQDNKQNFAKANDAFGTMLATSTPETMTRAFTVMPNTITDNGRVDVKI